MTIITKPFGEKKQEKLSVPLVGSSGQNGPSAPSVRNILICHCFDIPTFFILYLKYNQMILRVYFSETQFIKLCIY